MQDKIAVAGVGTLLDLRGQARAVGGGQGVQAFLGHGLDQRGGSVEGVQRQAALAGLIEDGFVHRVVITPDRLPPSGEIRLGGLAGGEGVQLGLVFVGEHLEAHGRRGRAAGQEGQHLGLDLMVREGVVLLADGHQLRGRESGAEGASGDQVAGRSRDDGGRGGFGAGHGMGLGGEWRLGHGRGPAEEGRGEGDRGDIHGRILL
ncbi:MAG: hypothetical protein A2V88_05535 [Elusimicrobia bacterium RBG_16_66_12]|nr:MAG: hypothetical protein A2V88_05535 [Elusimicrobia bacterium RBG_16_66_12]